MKAHHSDVPEANWYTNPRVIASKEQAVEELASSIVRGVLQKRAAEEEPEAPRPKAPCGAGTQAPPRPQPDPQAD